MIIWWSLGVQGLKSWPPVLQQKLSVLRLSGVKLCRMVSTKCATSTSTWDCWKELVSAILRDVPCAVWIVVGWPPASTNNQCQMDAHLQLPHAYNILGEARRTIPSNSGLNMHVESRHSGLVGWHLDHFSLGDLWIMFTRTLRKSSSVCHIWGRSQTRMTSTIAQFGHVWLLIVLQSLEISLCTLQNLPHHSLYPT